MPKQKSTSPKYDNRTVEEVRAQEQEPQPSSPKEATRQRADNEITPISWRLFDFFFVLNYLLIFLVILVIFIARCNKIVPEAEIAGYELQPMICPRVKLLKAPFGSALDTYKGWTEKVYNTKVSLAITTAHRVQVFFVAPCSLYLVFAFIFGWEDAKNWGVVHAAMMFYGMFIQDLVGWHALAEKKVTLEGGDADTFFWFTFGYATFFPLLVLWRLWGTEPFSVEEYKRNARSNILVKLFRFFLQNVALFWMLAAAVTYYEFVIKNLSLGRGLPSVWDSASPYVNQAMDTVNQQLNQFRQ